MRLVRTLVVPLGLTITLAAAGCGDDGGGNNGDDTRTTDTNVQADTSVGTDTTAGSDTTTPMDTMAPMDTTTPTDTAGPTDTTTPTDTLTPGDTGTPDSPSAQITAALTALANAESLPLTLGTSLPVDAVTVSFVKAQVGNDPGGFFVQEEQSGPALFVMYEDGNLTIEAGDRVSFDIDELDTETGNPMVSGLSNLMVTADAGVDPSTLVQDATSVDLDTNLADYALELISLTGTIDDVFENAGGGHEGATIVTTGNPGGDLVLRMPTDLAETSLLEPNCTFTLGGTPLWRYTNNSGTFTRVQPSAFTAADFTSISCPAPSFTAVATSSTEVVLAFTQTLDDNTVIADNFSIDGLTVSGASHDEGARTVTLTTSEQTEGTTYTVTTSSVTDRFATAVSPATATFDGFAPPALLLINELDYDNAGSDDMEYLEIYNPNDEAVMLADYTVELINGSASGDPVYDTFDLSDAGESLPAMGYLVIGPSAVVSGLGVSTIDLGNRDNIFQNSREALRILWKGAVVIDALAYEGDVEGYSEDGGTDERDSNSDSQPTRALARCPNGVDSNNNGADFLSVAFHTPGAANNCDDRLATCTEDMDASCPDTAAACGASFSGGQSCVSDGVGNCYDTGAKAYRLDPGDTVTVTFDGNVFDVEVFLGHAGDANGTIRFFTTDDGTGDMIEGSALTTSECVSTKPSRETASFEVGARSAVIEADGTTGVVYVDAFMINPE